MTEQELHLNVVEPRIPANLVLGCLAQRMTEEEIVQEYPTLTVAGIRAAAA